MSTDASGGSPRPGYLANLFNNEWFMPGLLFMAFGTLGLYVSRNYEMGTVNEMGPGFFPRMLCLGLVGLGAIIAWIGLFAKHTPSGKGSATRGFVLVLLSMAVFSLSIEGFTIPILKVKTPSLGFLGALTLTLLISALADRTQRLWEVLGTVALIVVMSVLIFTVALKLPFRLWPEF